MQRFLSFMEDAEVPVLHGGCRGSCPSWRMQRFLSFMEDAEVPVLHGGCRGSCPSWRMQRFLSFMKDAEVPVLHGGCMTTARDYGTVFCPICMTFDLPQSCVKR
ncbi:hypothetical protein ACOMHN_054544 [Nucella lapillus]